MASKDAGALETFYDRYSRVAFTMVLRIVHIREDAEDVLSDVFWQAWQQAGRYDATRRLCLEKLAEPQRIALEMAYFEGMSQTEIAKALNQPLGTMKDRIRSGMLHLRKCLKP